MSSRLSVLISISMCLVLGGCGAIGNSLNPYESEFSCKDSNIGGTCGSIQTHYAVSVDGKPETNGKGGTSVNSGSSDEVKTISLTDQLDVSYRKATLSKLNKLVEAPITPIVAPPTVMRILMLSYADDEDVLNMNRFSYIMLDKPRWVVGDGSEVADVR